MKNALNIDGDVQHNAEDARMPAAVYRRLTEMLAQSEKSTAPGDYRCMVIRRDFDLFLRQNFEAEEYFHTRSFAKLAIIS